MNKNKATISFHGGAGTVTGANFLIETGEKKFLVDCGLTQGKEFCDACNYDPFPYDPKEVDALIVTHGHTDHIGLIPRLVHFGFKGPIYSTDATKDIATVMYDDALKIMKMQQEDNGRELLYDKKDIDDALSIWKTLDYHKELELGDGVVLNFLDAGHILGSVMAEFSRTGKKLLFTGDLGNTPAPIVRDTEKVSDISYLVMESVYGDRNHEGIEGRHEQLKSIIEEVQKVSGVLLIPAFSLQRTQALLFEMNKMVEDKEIELIDVYLDTPLGIKILEIYRKYPQYFNETINLRIDAGDDPFDFSGLTLTPQSRDSRQIAGEKNPKIIIAGSGMSHGGRIRAHEIRFLGDKKTTLLFVGYQAAGSLGRRIQEGLKKVRIDEKWVHIRAKIKSITGYSAHKEMDQLIEFVEDTSDTLEKVFVAMGEPKSSLFLTQRLNDFLDVNAVVPNKGNSYTIDW
jgi:metallo-beta-lactamase family protein